MGRQEPAHTYLNQTAEQELKALGAAEQSFEQQALCAASLLTRSWVSHHFAPFDMSLHSLARLELFLDVLYRREAPPEPSTNALVQLLGAYIGETLRMSQGGHWDGSTTDIDSARVRTSARVWQPYQMLRHHLLSGDKLPLGASLKHGLASPGTPAWLSATQSPAPLPRLWETLPEAQHMPVLGAGLCHSIVSLACQLRSGVRLDRSIDSLPALDEVINIVTRSASPLNATEPWLQRLALLAGAYVGETVRLRAGGQWQSAPDSALLERYYIELPSGQQATPAATIAGRAVAGEDSQLEDYVGGLLLGLKKRP